jgi:hypothetical protein
MRPHCIVVPSPGFDDDLGLLARPKPFHRQALVTQLAVEGFVGAILPRFARIDVRSVDAGIDDLLQDRFGNKLRTIVAAQVAWCAMHTDQA